MDDPGAPVEFGRDALKQERTGTEWSVLASNLDASISTDGHSSLLIRLRGDLCDESAEQLSPGLSRILASNRETRVLLGLDGLCSLDSAGAHAISELAQRLSKQQRCLVLLGGSRQMEKALGYFNPCDRDEARCPR